MNKNAQNRRSRGRGGKQRHGNIRNQTFESNGPGVKVRGTAQQVLDKYLALARDASSSGDRIIAESYFQFAEHYFRLLNTEEQRNAERNGVQRRPGGERDRYSTPAGADASPDDLLADEMDSDGDNGDESEGEGEEDTGEDYEAGLQRAIGAAPPMRPRPAQENGAGAEAPHYQPHPQPQAQSHPQAAPASAQEDLGEGAVGESEQGNAGFVQDAGQSARPPRRRRRPQQPAEGAAPVAGVVNAAD